MLGHLENDSHTSFGQLDENNDQEPPSAPASLPSVPSFGTLLSVPSYGTLSSVPSFGHEDWCRLPFNAFADASTTSASPISPYFPGFTGSGSSTGVARSYATTPLSSTSAEIPRSSLPLLLETSSQVQSVESKPKKHAKFILEDPTMAKHKKEKAMRACTPCFTKRMECSEGETPNRCRHCVGKTSYCKGPIETPRLLDLERVDVYITALLARYYGSIGFQPESESFGLMQVDVRSEPPSDQEIVSDRQTHRIQLPGLRYDFSFFPESSNFDSMLDAVLPADVPLCIAPRPGLYDLSSYERLCRRLCASISLLRRPNECTLDERYKNDHRAVHIVIVFLRQLSRKASSILADIFDHVRGCCFATRDRRGTPNLMFILAEHLGHMHKEFRHLMDVMEQSSNSLPLNGLLHNAPQNLEELENLGRGLCLRSFDSTSMSPVLDIAGVHLTPCFEPSPYNNTDDIHTLYRDTSFSDILRGSALPPYPTGDLPVPIMCTNNTIESWQDIDVRGSTLSVGHEWKDGIGNDQEMITEDHVPLGIKELQTEAKAILNPGWTLDLHDFAVTQNDEASVGADHFHTRIHDSMAHCQDINWEQQSSEIQQAGHAYIRDTIPAYTDIGDSMLTSLPDQSDTTQPLENANTSAMLYSTTKSCSLPVPTPAETPMRASKRKAIKTVFSRKKPCLTPSRLSHSEHSSASTTSTTNLPAKLARRTESEAKTTATHGMKSSMQPSDGYPAGQVRADWVPTWEEGSKRRTNLDNAGIVRDIEILDSERRPLSWPHRNPWRKSLDISVAVLTKRFEKLMTERGQTAVSAT